MESEIIENKPKSNFSNTLYYGCLTGAALVIYSLLLYITGQFMNKWLGYVSMLILIAGMIIGTVKYRNQNKNGFMSYGDSFLSCFLIGLFAAIISAIYTLIFYTLIDPGMIQQLMDIARQKMQESAPQLTEEQLDKALSIQKNLLNPAILPLMSLITNVLYSVIFSLLLSIFLRREDKTMDQIM